MLVVSLIVAIYYNVIMAYSIIYVGVSFRGITDPEVNMMLLIRLKMRMKMSGYAMELLWQVVGS